MRNLSDVVCEGLLLRMGGRGGLCCLGFGGRGGGMLLWNVDGGPSCLRAIKGLLDWTDVYQVNKALQCSPVTMYDLYEQKSGGGKKK